MNQRSKKSNRKKLVLLGALIIVSGLSLVLLTRPQTNPVRQPVSSDSGSIQVAPPLLSAMDVLADVNAERQASGLPVLVHDARLDASATQKVTELAQTGWSSSPHVNPNTGIHGFRYALEHDSDCVYAAENLSYQNNSSQAVVYAWEASPEHLAAMNGNYQAAGVAVSGPFVALHLCRW